MNLKRNLRRGCIWFELQVMVYEVDDHVDGDYVYRTNDTSTSHTDGTAISHTLAHSKTEEMMNQDL